MEPHKIRFKAEQWAAIAAHLAAMHSDETPSAFVRRAVRCLIATEQAAQSPTGTMCAGHDEARTAR